MIWDFETITLLCTLWSEGHSTAEIGRRLGCSKNAVVGKANRLGLDARPSPIRRFDDQAALKRKIVETRLRSPVTLQPLLSLVRGAPVEPVLAAAPPAPRSVPLPPPAPIRHGACQFPAWSHTERPKFGADGNPLVCSAPAAHGPYCPTHRAVCYTKTQRMANAA